MKKLKTKLELKKAVLKGNKYLLWKKKKAKKYIVDFMVIEAYNEDMFKGKEYCLNEVVPINEQVQEIHFDSIDLVAWEINLLSEKEAGNFLKQVMVRKLREIKK